MQEASKQYLDEMRIKGSSKKYGDVWSQPAENLEMIKNECSSEIEAFKKALSLGYFSQYTSYRQKDLVARLVDWQLNLLSKWLGDDLSRLPESLDELSIIPEVLLESGHGRVLSPDLLRNLWYVLFLYHQQSLSSNTQMSNIVEIGSGYGSFARVMKAYFPSACIWLLDLPESLQFAKTYLAESYPDASILLIDSPDDVISESVKYDFVLVPVNESNRMVGKHFDLGVNIWSFGEMPNGWIDHWFDLLQEKCIFDRLYLLNAFSSPVTSQSIDRTRQGNWLMKLNDRWDVKDFQIDPEIHRCPWIRNFYTGLNIYCERISTTDDLANYKKAANQAVDGVLLEDWVAIAMGSSSIANFERPETNIDSTPDKERLKNNFTVSVTNLLSITEYIGHPRFESGVESTFYRLWNDFRFNSDPLSGSLLIVYLAMVFKTELRHRCTKEEIFLLEKLPDGSPHQEYQGMALTRSNEITIEYKGQLHTVQQLSDFASDNLRAGNVEEADAIALTIAITMNRHGDCWHQLALIAESKCQIWLSVLLAAHASYLASENEPYLSEKVRLLQRFKSSLNVNRILFSLSTNVSDKYRDKLISIFCKMPIMNKSTALYSIILAGYMFGGERDKYVKLIPDLVKDKVSSDLYDALMVASTIY